jgi:hypothetical protein
MLCTACGSELILTKVVPDDTVDVRGIEHHTFICSACHVTEHRVVFIKGGRETDGPPMQAAPPIKRASTEQDEHVAAPGRQNETHARGLGGYLEVGGGDRFQNRRGKGDLFRDVSADVIASSH